MVPSRLAGAAHPVVYEINTLPWLAGLSHSHDATVDLSCVPTEVWDDLGSLGVDAIWLMGVWERSPAGMAIAMTDEGLVAGFRKALPDFRDEDVVGSPYCIRRYDVDQRLGGRVGLAVARAVLAERGIGLLLDFVPNHLAPDHPWTTEHPEYFVGGSADDLSADPASFLEVGGSVLARGRDPYFPAWPDVVQLDAFSGALRDAVVDTLLDIADQCDGVRCDMAMLMLNDVFEQTWGVRVGPAPPWEYWTHVIGAVHQRHPDFRFIAEAYWDREWDLQQVGFDFCYDKRLYDRLLHDAPESVRLHLCAEIGYQNGLVRFIENHDEPRIAGLVPRRKNKAMAVAALTQTGARLIHDGQLVGRRVHLPVFLGRFPEEPEDVELEAFYRDLLGALADPTFHSGCWQPCDRWGWPDNPSWRNLVAWSWADDSSTRWIVAVNLADVISTGRIATRREGLRGRHWTLTDPTTGAVFDRAGDDLVDGFFVQLDPWHWHLWRVAERDGAGLNSSAHEEKTT
jgi:hypothetical protein